MMNMMQKLEEEMAIQELEGFGLLVDQEQAKQKLVKQLANKTFVICNLLETL